MRLGTNTAVAMTTRPVADPARILLRSQTAAIVLFGGASLWFLYYVSQLGKADFGDYKVILLIIFGTTAAGIARSRSRIARWLSRAPTSKTNPSTIPRR